MIPSSSPSVNFPANNLNFHWSWGWSNPDYHLKSFLLYAEIYLIMCTQKWYSTSEVMLFFPLVLYHTCTFIFAIWRLVFKRHWNLESQEIRKMQGQSLQGNRVWRYLGCKVEKIQKGSLDLIPSPSPLVKIQYVGVKICLRCKGKTLFFFFKSLLISPSNVLPYYLK